MGRTLFAPEVLQTSGMDCGPAALKCVLGALGISASYEKLRDACQTGADGTSIDALEDLATELGLEAFQEMAPMADVAAALSAHTPCVVVVKGVGGAPHFIVLHCVLGPFAQIMDPAVGRRFVRLSSLVRDLYVHEQRFDEASFASWWTTTEWARITAGRARARGIGIRFAELSGRALAALDTAARFAERVARRGATRAEAELVLRRLLGEGPPITLPQGTTAARVTEDGQIAARGALFLVVRGNPEQRASPLAKEILGRDGPSPAAVLLSLLRKSAAPLVLTLALLALATAFVTIAEVVFLRAAFNARAALGLPHQRFAGAVLYATLLAAALGLDLALSLGAARAGRLVETRTRAALLEKLPRLPDRYFRSRPLSDVAHRSQGLFELRALPESALAVFKHALDVIVTVAAMIAVDPRGAHLSLLALAAALALPIAALGARRRVELRVQSHASALGQLYLDALMGLVPLRTHGARASLAARQGESLVPWRRESERAIDALTATDAAQSVGTLAAVALLLLRFVGSGGDTATLLLFAFWSLRLPLHARALSTALQRLPELFASIARVAEPLAAEETAPVSPGGGGDTMVMGNRRGVAIALRSVTLTLGGSRVLRDVSLAIRPGERVAIVGSSGAGKSSLVACLLGLLEPERGEVRVDGLPLARFDVGRLRRETVWVDPAVQLWNRSLLDNLTFGNPRGAREPMRSVLELPDVREVVLRLPRGLATELGESGARVSGGEGQRVRLGRALLRRGSRLVLLDEAFRGLDRETRRELSRKVRTDATGATVLEVTHDVSDTRDFDRVVVIEDGELVEQGAPEELLATSGSRYAELVAADARVVSDVWGDPRWRRHTLTGNGTILDANAEVGP